MTYKNDITIILPVYEDTSSTKLLAKDISGLSEFQARLVIIDDGSRLYPPQYEDFSDLALNIKIIRLKENCGHQVAIAVGLKYVAANFPNSPVIVMDADGEDPANAIPHLYNSLGEKKSVIVAGRLNRHRSVIIRFCYVIYWCTARVLTGHSICFGNFSALSASAVAKIGKLETTPVHFAATIIASSLRYSVFRIERNERYCSQSKMTFVGLVKLAFRSISLFRRKVFIRLTALSVPGLILWVDLLYFQFFLDASFFIAYQEIFLVFLSLFLFIPILGFIFLGFIISTIKSNKRIVENTKNVNILTSDPVTTT